MRSNEGSPRGGARTDPRRHAPGSRPARLAEAGKQLAILLEGADLDDEPDLGRALTDAVTAVERAAELVDGREGERVDGRDGERGDGEPGAWDQLVEDAHRNRGTRTGEGAGREPPVESGGLQFVGGAGVE